MDGTIVEGETNITEAGRRLKNLRLKPEGCGACAEAIDAIDNADLIILGPGSVYTSVLPNLLIHDIFQAVLKSDAHKFYIMNVMTQPGETDNLSAWDHLRVILEHTDPRIIDTCIVNTQAIPQTMIQKYAEKGAGAIQMDLDTITEKGYEVVQEEILKIDGQVRHDPEKLARVVFDHFYKLSKAVKV